MFPFATSHFLTWDKAEQCIKLLKKSQIEKSIGENSIEIKNAIASILVTVINYY